MLALQAFLSQISPILRLLRSISSHFSLISVLTVTADVHVEHSVATNDSNRSVEQEKIDGRMSFFIYTVKFQK